MPCRSQRGAVARPAGGPRTASPGRARCARPRARRGSRRRVERSTAPARSPPSRVTEPGRRGRSVRRLGGGHVRGSRGPCRRPSGPPARPADRARRPRVRPAACSGSRCPPGCGRAGPGRVRNRAPWARVRPRSRARRRPRTRTPRSARPRHGRSRRAPPPRRARSRIRAGTGRAGPRRSWTAGPIPVRAGRRSVG